jgi:hypothetical protein
VERVYLDPRIVIFLFQHCWGGREVYVFFKWKPATNPFGFVLRIENSGDVAQAVDIFCQSILRNV